MTENERIEEMARDIDSGDDCIEPCKECAHYCYPNCRDVKIAKRLYAKDYRKVERGEWIEQIKIARQSNLPPLYYYQCNRCSVYLSKRANFCPNCGADMRGTTDER